MFRVVGSSPTIAIVDAYTYLLQHKEHYMNPVLFILILLGAFILWLLLSFVFYPLGKIGYRLWKDAIDEMNRESDKKETKE